MNDIRQIPALFYMNEFEFHQMFLIYAWIFIEKKSRSSRLLCIQRENKTFCFMGSLWANKLGIDISVSPSIWNSYAEEKGKFPLPPIPRSNPGPHEYVSGDTCGRRRPRVTQSHLVAAFASLDKKCYIYFGGLKENEKLIVLCNIEIELLTTKNIGR